MLTRKVEDYLEAILNITDEKGYARTKDIAQRLDVTPPSVVEMMKKLNDMRYVNYRKYDGITLTPEGKAIAAAVRERHDIIRDFLKIINVPQDIANKDACTIEHNLNPKTITQIKKLVDFVETAPGCPKWVEHFELFCKTGTHECEQRKES
ncbi:MAG: metal-dependent transcriptional regulator [Thermoplasmata archaeon]|nr:metal-dependent transcriptional regulator [Thermoplasmata archaeon]